MRHMARHAWACMGMPMALALLLCMAGAQTIQQREQQS